jgi:hypothetical protein
MSWERFRELFEDEFAAARRPRPSRRPARAMTAPTTCSPAPAPFPAAGAGWLGDGGGTGEGKRCRGRHQDSTSISPANTQT